MHTPNPSRGMLIFDLDGTLTIPVLDFDAMRAEANLPPGPILESLASLEGEQRKRALDVVHAHEEQAARHSQLQPGAKETLSILRKRGWPIGILTRNAQQWANIILDAHGIDVDLMYGREVEPTKPSPEPILKMCAELGCVSQQSWMIGDHMMDIECGRAAGCHTVLMVGDGDVPSRAGEAGHVIRLLDELAAIVGRPGG